MSKHTEHAATLTHSPIRALRKRAGHSLTSAARAANVHYQYWFLAEFCCYPTPPVAVVKALRSWGIDDNSLLYLYDAYELFQLRQRQNFGDDHHEAMVRVPSAEDAPAESFKEWREEYLELSRIGLAKELCVHPAILYKVEKGQSAKLPEQLVTAFLDAGMSERVFDYLERLVIINYERSSGDHREDSGEVESAGLGSA